MYTIKGFATINSLADNASNVISPLGELSANAQTYSRESDKGHYTDPNKGEVTFVSFYCHDEDNEQQPVPQAYQASILTITNWLHDKALLGQIPTDTGSLIQNINNEFDSTIENVQAGSIITSGVIRLPSWVSWSISAEADGNRVKVWFSNSSFLAEYDQYELLVIPPVDDLDSLFMTSPEVQELVDSRTVPQLMDKVNTARGNSPYTRLTTLTYDRVSIVSPAVIPTDWTLIGYGVAGNNLDIQRQTLVDYILANSTHTREEWKQILPSLFTATEFIITPFFNKVSIPNLTEAAGLYSPIVGVNDIQDQALLASPDYPEVHVLNVVRVSFSTYKSLPFVAVGGTENLDGIVTLDEKFPDYIAVAPTSPDYNRMSPLTQEWSWLLHELIKAAEEMTPFSDVPPTVGRVTRGDLLYASGSLNGTQYLVTTKWSVNNP